MYIHVHIRRWHGDKRCPAYIYSRKLSDLLLPAVPASSIVIFIVYIHCCIFTPPPSPRRSGTRDHSHGGRRVNQKNAPFARAGHTSRMPRLASAIFGRARASDRRAPGSPLGAHRASLQCWSCNRRVCVYLVIGRAKSHPRLPVARNPNRSEIICASYSNGDKVQDSGVSRHRRKFELETFPYREISRRRCR